VINPAHASYLTCTHDACIRGRLVPCTKKARPFFPRAAFPASSPCRPAIPLLSLSLRFAVSSSATDYTVPFPLMNHFLPPSSAIRTLVACCYRVRAWEGGRGRLGSHSLEVVQHDSGIIFCTNLAALPSHQLLKTSVAAFLAALFLFLRDFLLSPPLAPSTLPPPDQL
jgi:hypothetical protein